MTYRIRVEHVSRYRYATVVHSSYNETRLTPLTTPWQLVLDSRVTLSPAVALQGYVDYWGSVVHAFDLQHPHDELVIIGQSVVETSMGPDEVRSGPHGRGGPDGASTAGFSWADLDQAVVAQTFAEFLAPTGHVPHDDRLYEVAAGLLAGPTGSALPRPAPADAAEAAVAWVGDQLAYVPGTTGVHTSAVEAWDGGEGVCQDFAHLTLAVLRTMGIPARYCSGYVHPHGDAEVGQTVKGESHAWIEYWAGAWTAVDPTAGRSIGEHHVLVGRGRDYADVPPVKGIFHGGPTAGLDVTVELTRLA